jgi:hypothetical protein
MYICVVFNIFIAHQPVHSIVQKAAPQAELKVNQNIHSAEKDIQQNQTKQTHPFPIQRNPYH